MNNNYSILRRKEYAELEKINFTGDILDLGGSVESGYSAILKKNQGRVTGVNIAGGEKDIKADIEKGVPLPDSAYDFVVCFNVLEHLFEYRTALAESARLLKSGGQVVISVPFLYQIHYSPDDFHRFTRSCLEKELNALEFSQIEVKELGDGLFSLVSQVAVGVFPGNWCRRIIVSISMALDRLLLKSKRYQNLNKRIPLGYFVTARKK